jgi:hypothetical protein
MTRWLLIASGALAWLFAAMLLFAAREFEAPVGIEVTDKVATIAQAQGALLFGIGLINLLARNVSDATALRAILAGNLAVQLVSLAVAVRALLLGLFPASGAPSVVIHVALGALFIVALLRTRRVAVGAAT